MLKIRKKVNIITSVAILVGVAGFGAVQAADETEVVVDKSKWKCQFCLYEERAKFAASVELGLGYVSNDSYKYGEYTGLTEEGVYFLGNANGSYRDKKANYFNFDFKDIGLDSRVIEMEGGKQGLYDLDFEYNQIPKYTSDTSRTPYSGGNDQSLPSDWVSAPTTPGFTSLGNDLQDVGVYTMRRDFSLGATVRQSKTISYDLRFRRTTKKGNEPVGAPLGPNFATMKSATLVAPVEYITDFAEAAVLYNAKRIRGKIAYQVSLFKNENQALRWQNAFSVPAGVTEGQLGTPPDNSMHQITVAGGYDVLNSLTLTGQLAFGQMMQDESFLPYTINNSLTPPALPRSSLGGEINTVVGNFNVLSRPTPKLNLNFKYSHDEFDNKTPSATYDYVIADSAVSTTARVNLPYSFRKRKALLEGNYKLPAKSLLSLGADYETYDRTYQEVETTQEASVWAKFKSRPHKMVEFIIGLETSGRDGDAYTPVAEIQPQENPLLRKYNQADRDRALANFHINVMPIDSLVLGFAVDASKDQYTDSPLGLQESTESAYTLDAFYMLSTIFSINAFYSYEEINSNQSNMQGATTWVGENEDTFDTAGLGIKYYVLKDKLDLGLDFVHAEGNGKVSIVSKTPFPDLVSKRDTIEFSSNYQYNEKLMLKFIYRYEKYDETNWAIDGVSNNTLDNVLTLGNQSPSYQIGSFALSAQYKF